MKAKRTAPQSIDEYIAGYPKDVQAILEKIRTTIRKAVPDAEETLSYQIPAFTLRGRAVVYVAAYKKHVGLYPAPVGNAKFKADLSAYAAGKGTARFPLDEPIPFGLISRIAKFLAKESQAATAVKARKKP